MAEHGPHYVIDYPAGQAQTTIADDAFIDLAAAFGRVAPIVVEIGPVLANSLFLRQRNIRSGISLRWKRGHLAWRGV